MKRILFSFIFILLIGHGFAQIPSGYYDSAQDKTGYELKTALFNIIKNPNVDSYTGLWSDFYKTDVDKYYENDGTVLDPYSENPTSSDPYNFTLGSDQCGNYSGEGSCYNREHSFPKSWFNDASPMYSDLFHIYPTDGYVNNRRSSYPYGETDNPTWTSMNGSKLGPCSIAGYSGTVFEPIDEFKGDLARTYFYMATCYEDQISTWSSDVLDGSSDKCYEDWFLNMLIQWHEQDPVSQKEIDRNDSIYTIQGNRNPFIDHPDWVECIWLNSCSGTNIVANPDNFTATAVSSSQIDLSWTLNADNDSVVLAYNTSNTFGTPSGNYSAGDNISGGGTVLYVGTAENFSHTGLSAQTYYYKIWSVDTLEYSTGIETSATPFLPEPTNHVTNFTVSGTTTSSITLTWTDATGGTEPTAYLVKAVLSGNTISLPTDGTPETDGTYAKNINQGTQTVTFDGFNADTQYDFEIFPYTNTGSNIDYKTDGTIPATTGKTDTIPVSTGDCENFDSGLASSYTTDIQTLSTGDWYTVSVYAEAATDSYGGTGSAARLNDDTPGASLRTPSLNTVGTITFYYRELNTGGGTFAIQKSYDNSTWTDIASQSFSGTTYTQYSLDVNDAAGTIYIRIVNDDNPGHLIIDDFCWTSYNCTTATPPDTVFASSTTICSGENVTLSYSGGSGDTFRWFTGSCGGTEIGTGNDLNVTPTSTTTYYGRWENSCSTSECKSVTITVNPTVEITQQPQSQNVCEGDDITFSIVANGNNLTYQWQKDGTDLTGETGTSLIIPNVSDTDQGSYTCIVSGDCGTTTSNAASLDVSTSVSITEQPQSQEICQGTDVTFSVTVTGSNPTYQWIKDGNNISGANQSSLTITNATTSDAGTYICNITNSCGTVTSNNATLTVNSSPLITENPQSQDACLDQSLTLNITATGDNLSYQWQKDGNDITGETDAALFIPNITFDQAGAYTCVVSNDCGQTVSDTANVRVIQHTLITQQPHDTLICEGDNLILFVSATGENLTYQWQKDGTDISGANSDTLLINTASVIYAGNYNCIVAGACGQEVSDTAVVDIVICDFIPEISTNISIVPNPNNGHFEVITSSDMNNANLSIIDLTGKIVFSSKITSSNTEINIESPISGLYILKIRSQDKIFYKKIIIH